MNSKNAMRWMIGQIDPLVASGVLSAESGQSLRTHFQSRLGEPSHAGRILLLSILGAFLIGGGIILILAHNWEEMGRPLRAALSLLPLAGALALCGWALWRRPGSAAWREATGAFLVCGIFSSVALISQTYNMGGELYDYLFICTLLTLPAAYVLMATTPAIACLVGGMAWVIAEPRGQTPGWHWLFPLAMVPYAAFLFWKNRSGWLANVFTAILGVAVAVHLINDHAFEESSGRLKLWALSGLFGFYYLAGARLFPERRYALLRILGGVSLCVWAVVFSFRELWPHPGEELWHETFCGLLFPAAALGMLAWAAARRERLNWTVACCPLVFFGCMLLLHATAAAVVMSLYGLAMALASAFRGFAQNAWPTLNGGLLLLIALVWSRFADSSISMVGRGVAFILLGLLLLGANILLMRRKKTEALS